MPMVMGMAKLRREGTPMMMISTMVNRVVTVVLTLRVMLWRTLLSTISS